MKKTIEEMQNVVYSTRAHTPQPVQPEGVLLYMKTTEGNDSLIYVDRDGNSVTQSQLAVLRVAACEESTPAIPRDKQHHLLCVVVRFTLSPRSQSPTRNAYFGAAASLTRGAAQ